MIATDPSCLTDAQLRDVAQGRLPAHRFTRLLEHLDSCAECQSRAEAVLEPDDSLAVALAIPPTADPLAAEAECVAALHRAASHRELPAASSTPPIDRLGPYQLIRPLGSGGMGAVFLAEHTRLRRRCAIKLLPRDRGFDAAWRDRFDREMAAVAALDHPHIVSASDAGESAGWHFLVMEYLDGLDLSRLAGRLGQLGTADACELVRQAAVGLAHIHASGLIHRDIKPSNLMLSRDGVVKILDLGLVLSGTDPLPSEDRLTTVGQLMGTLAYMAPEQLVDSTTVDHRSDLYALGATLYRLLAGVAPHAEARGLAPLVIAKTGQGAPAVTSHRSDLPGPLAELIGRLLDPNPKRRPRTASEIAEALEPFAATAHPDRLVAAALRRPATEEESIPLLPLVLPQKANAHQPPPRRRFGILAAAAAFPLLLLAGIAIIVQTDRGQLVIESDRPGLTVAVEQGEEVVEQLQLETGENRVTLRSGTYTVTLDTPADGLRLSDNTASITRGGETVLRVRREEALSASATKGPPVAAHAPPLYQGQTLDHWLAVLESDRDVATVTEAIHAVIALVKDGGSRGNSMGSGDSDGSRVAKAVLRAARHFGGITADAGAGSTPSQRFMNDLLESYPALLPHPGLGAISSELAAGNRESAMAAIWILNNYVSDAARPIHDSPNALERWSDSEPGREKLQTLAENLNQAVERLGGYSLPPYGSDAHAAVAQAYEVRLYLEALRGIDSLADPVIRDRLYANVQTVAQENQQKFAKIDAREVLHRASRVRPLTNQEIALAIRELDPTTAAWAAVPHLLLRGREASESASDQLKELAVSAPTATANSTILAMVMPTIPLSHEASGRTELWQQAIEHAAEFSSDPEAALAVFERMENKTGQHWAADPKFAPFAQSVQSASQKLRERVFGP